MPSNLNQDDIKPNIRSKPDIRYVLSHLAWYKNNTVNALGIKYQTCDKSKHL